MPVIRPNNLIEQQLGERHALLISMDEVGIGALAGPLAVGAVLVPKEMSPPDGLADSKQLTHAIRFRLVPEIHHWVSAWAIGWATAAEIDHIGVRPAMGLAARRCLAHMPAGFTAVLLDGNRNYLGLNTVQVTCVIKADQSCCGVAAASILAKVARDAHMVRLARRWPGYHWDRNKGYGSPAHKQAIRTLGPCAQHRRSWNLLGAEPLPTLFDLEDEQTQTSA